MSNRPDGRPWRKYRHNSARLTYEEMPDSRVRVTHDDGRTGLFHCDGRYIEGELTQVNTHMLTWCGGPDIPKAFKYPWGEVPIDTQRPSGWPEYMEKAFKDNDKR